MIYNQDDYTRIALNILWFLGTFSVLTLASKTCAHPLFFSPIHLQLCIFFFITSCTISPCIINLLKYFFFFLLLDSCVFFIVVHSFCSSLISSLLLLHFISFFRFLCLFLVRVLLAQCYLLVMIEIYTSKNLQQT